MNIVILGLSITSSWGNGHATTYRGLARELHLRGHRVLFLERDKPWYAGHRDLREPDYCEVALYSGVEQLQDRYADAVAGADFVMLGSFVPDGDLVAEWMTQTATGATAFYDIDTPITLSSLSNHSCEYLQAKTIPEFDFYLSFTGGPTLNLLKVKYGAAQPEAFYCSVDTVLYGPQPLAKRWDLGYLGTYSVDRHASQQELLVQPALRHPGLRAVVAGSLYPDSTTWPANVHRIEHLAPSQHAGFYNSQRFTLNLTRASMIAAGYSPSVRLFEAAACGTPIISDAWPGLDTFFEPGHELLIATEADDVLRYLHDLSETQRISIGERGRARILREHTASHRAAQLEQLLRGGRPARTISAKEVAA